MSQKDEVVKKIIERAVVIFQKNPDELSENTRFAEDLMAKSGNVSQMTTFLEDEFDVEIAFMQFRRMATIGEAAAYIVELMNE